MIERMYYSREDRIAELNEENSRVQYDTVENDLARINEAWDAFSSYSDSLEDAVDEYTEAMQEEGEDAPSRMRYARRELIEQWCFAQATLSKLAWVLRVDGNEAYQRMINALKHGNVVDVSDL